MVPTATTGTRVPKQRSIRTGTREQLQVDQTIDLRGPRPRPRAADAALRRTRALDITGAVVLLIAAIPALCLIAFAVKVTDRRSPILFRQTRVGLHGREIQVLKFRTMSSDAPDTLAQLLETDDALAAEYATNAKLRTDPRVSAVGRVLRPTGLDELPQLLNVLEGDMSLVGPRPLVPDEVARYGSDAAIVQSVPPGITGPWQIGGRNDISYSERVRIDCEYALSKSLRIDVFVLARTLLLLATFRLRGGY